MRWTLSHGVRSVIVITFLCMLYSPFTKCSVLLYLSDFHQVVTPPRFDIDFTKHDFTINIFVEFSKKNQRGEFLYIECSSSCSEFVFIFFVRCETKCVPQVLCLFALSMSAISRVIFSKWASSQNNVLEMIITEMFITFMLVMFVFQFVVANTRIRKVYWKHFYLIGDCVVCKCAHVPQNILQLMQNTFACYVWHCLLLPMVPCHIVKNCMIVTYKASVFILAAIGFDEALYPVHLWI